VARSQAQSVGEIDANGNLALFEVLPAWEKF